MRLLINSAHIRFGGAFQVSISVIKECIKFPENEYHIVLSKNLSNKIDRKQFPSNFNFYVLDFGDISFFKSFKINQTLKKLENKIMPDVVFSNSGPTYFNSKAPQVVGFNLPLYIYPETPFFHRFSLIKWASFLLKKRIQEFFFKRDAIAYVVQTDDVNQRVRKFLNTTKVYTVTNNYNQFFEIAVEKNSKLLPSRVNNDEFRFVTISSYYSHKDLELIPKISKYLKSKGIFNVKFILTMNNQTFIEKLEKEENVINIGPISPDLCPQLYFESDGLFLPTLAECFSANYAEAMIMQKPIITTDLGFARSICGSAALYFKPSSTVEAGNAIENLINNKALQDQLKVNGLKELDKFDSAFTRTKKYLEICKNYSKEFNG